MRSTSGPINLDLEVDTGSGFVLAGSAVVPDTIAGAAMLTFDLTPFTGVTTATFRLIGYNAGNSNGTLSFLESGNGMDVDIVVTAVPEASSFALAGTIAGVLGLGVAGKRRWMAAAA